MVQPPPPTDLKGNADFVLPKDVETPKEIELLDPMKLDDLDDGAVAAGAVLSPEPPNVLKETDEEGLLAEDTEPEIIDQDTEIQLKPATTVNEFLRMIATAKAKGLKHIEATQKVICHFSGTSTPPECGYMIYHNIRVYLPHEKDKADKRDARSMEQVIFSKSKVQIKDIEKPKY